MIEWDDSNIEEFWIEIKLEININYYIISEF